MIKKYVQYQSVYAGSGEQFLAIWAVYGFYLSLGGYTLHSFYQALDSVMTTADTTQQLAFIQRFM